jgi:hypothetical protein
MPGRDGDGKERAKGDEDDGCCSGRGVSFDNTPSFTFFHKGSSEEELGT